MKPGTSPALICRNSNSRNKIRKKRVSRRGHRGTATALPIAPAEDSDVECDPVLQELVDKYARIRDNKFKQVICQIKSPFDASEECCRYQEGVMTNWICDAVAEDYSVKDGLQSADFTMIMGLHFAGKKASGAWDGGLLEVVRRSSSSKKAPTTTGTTSL